MVEFGLFSDPMVYRNPNFATLKFQTNVLIFFWETNCNFTPTRGLKVQKILHEKSVKLNNRWTMIWPMILERHTFGRSIFWVFVSEMRIQFSDWKVAKGYFSPRLPFHLSEVKGTADAIELIKNLQRKHFRRRIFNLETFKQLK